ncbi:MAG: alanine racemase [Eubacteriales bacterium]|nr:alanine racemase [Eubacteriales bacterium]
MPSPLLLIDQQAFRENALRLNQVLAAQGKFCHFDCSSFASQTPLLEMLARKGLTRFASSRVVDFNYLGPYAQDRLLLRSPMLSEVAAVVDLCDLSCNTEWQVICALSDAALVRQKVHRVLVQVDLGDLTSGLQLEAAEQLIAKLVNLRGVRLAGLKTTFNGYGGILPDLAKLEELTKFAKFIEQRFGIGLEYVSGLNSSALSLLDEKKLPPDLRHFVIGETLLTGREAAYGGSFAGLNQNIFSLQAEVVEAQRRPSLPQGQSGHRNRDTAIHYEDRGLIQRVNLAFGRQELAGHNLEPKLRGIRYLGQTQDQTFYDVTGLNKRLGPGDHLEFMLNYPGLLQALVSAYISKVLV